FLTKLNAAGSAPLAYSTYLGGLQDDDGFAVAIGPSGAAYVTGYTASTDFPISGNAYKSSNQGGKDAFLSLLVPTVPGNGALPYSTYLGGSGDDYGRGIGVDPWYAAWVAGDTASTDFPTQGALPNQGNNSGGTDAFVTRLLPGSSAPTFSTYLGGS